MTGGDASALPQAVLHDHLDGGLRVETLIELAAAAGYTNLPATEPTDLAAAMHQDGVESLADYLAIFSHTVAVMQTAPAIERVAYEAAIDHAADGVVYAEIRFGPSLLTEGGLHREAAIEAALTGLRRAEGETGLAFGLIVTALRDQDDSDQVALAAARFVGDGVVGFDLAGPEIGYPAENHLAAIRLAREWGLGITLHAGEAVGPEAIATAIGKCAADRIGHGVRIIDDCSVQDGEIVDLGRVAARVRDHGVPLEISISSNLHTGVAPDAKSHPLGMLYRAGFNVSINTDNRLMSAVSMSSELALAQEAFGLRLTDLAVITTRTLEAGFGDWAVRNSLIQEVVGPAYAAAISGDL